MSRTDTTAKPSFERSNVTFVFPTNEKPFATKILIHEHSTWTPSPHWHEKYTEYFKVLQGRALLTVDGVTREVTSADGEQAVPKFAIHDFSRADIDASAGEGDTGAVIIEERVEPADGSKELFFRNIFSVLEDSRVYGRALPLQIILTSRYLDNYDVFLPGPLSYYVTHSVFAVAGVAASAMGMRPWYEEYTPERLRSIAASQGVTSQKSD